MRELEMASGGCITDVRNTTTWLRACPCLTSCECGTDHLCHLVRGALAAYCLADDRAAPLLLTLTQALKLQI